MKNNRRGRVIMPRLLFLGYVLWCFQHYRDIKHMVLGFILPVKITGVSCQNPFYTPETESVKRSVIFCCYQR